MKKKKKLFILFVTPRKHTRRIDEGSTVAGTSHHLEIMAKFTEISKNDSISTVIYGTMTTIV